MTGSRAAVRAGRSRGPDWEQAAVKAPVRAGGGLGALTAAPMSGDRPSYEQLSIRLTGCDAALCSLWDCLSEFQARQSMGSLLLGPDGEVLQLSLYENHADRLQLAHRDEVTEEEKGTVSCGINDNGYFYL